MERTAFISNYSIPQENPPEGATQTIYIINHKNQLRSRQIPNKTTVFKIGNAEDADLRINDPSISKYQLTMVRIGDLCYFMDCGAKDMVYFNGIKKRQAIVPVDSRMTFKIGHTLLVYHGSNSSESPSSISRPVDCSMMTNTEIMNTKRDALVQLDSKFGERISIGAPILIGSHQSCDYLLPEDFSERFHFIVYFKADGLYLEDLTHGSPGIKVNNLSCIGSRKISENLTVSIKDVQFNLSVHGDLKEHVSQLFHKFKTQPKLTLTSIGENDTTCIVLPRTKQPISVGRQQECHLTIDDPSVSRQHAFLQIRDKCLFITDNDSANKTRVNLSIIKKTILYPGDLIEFGNKAFLLTYQ